MLVEQFMLLEQLMVWSNFDIEAAMLVLRFQVLGSEVHTVEPRIYTVTYLFPFLHFSYQTNLSCDDVSFFTLVFHTVRVWLFTKLYVVF